MTYIAPYTLAEYTNLIRRELAKRQSAYPKIMQKRIREGYTIARKISEAVAPLIAE